MADKNVAIKITAFVPGDTCALVLHSPLLDCLKCGTTSDDPARAATYGGHSTPDGSPCDGQFWPTFVKWGMRLPVSAYHCTVCDEFVRRDWEGKTVEERMDMSQVLCGKPECLRQYIDYLLGPLAVPEYDPASIAREHLGS